MTTQAVDRANPAVLGLEKVLIEGDLGALSPEDRIRYYTRTCESLGLNPLTKPFEYLKLNGRLVLYARRDATDQLRQLRGVSIVRLEREVMGDVYAVTAYARDAAGREDSSIGAVSIERLSGDALANAYMKAETKAKRRVTLSICGLGMLDETEIETIPDARPAGDSFRARVETTPAAAQPVAVTEKSVEAIAQRAARKGVDNDAMTALLGEYRVETVWELSAGQARELYARLGKMADAPAPVPAEEAGGDGGLFQGEMTL